MNYRPANTMQSFNRRSVNYDEVPEPMRVSEAAFNICREYVEPAWKAWVRSLLLPYKRWRSGAWEIGEGFQWGKGMSIRGARIGRYVYVGPGTKMSGPVSIGDLCMLSNSIMLVSNDHEHRDPSKPMRVAFAPLPRPVTVIEADCLIGCNAIIHEGVRICRGTIVGAGAVVTKDTAPYTIVVGCPAKPIGMRFSRMDTRTYDSSLYEERKSEGNRGFLHDGWPPTR